MSNLQGELELEYLCVIYQYKPVHISNVTYNVNTVAQLVQNKNSQFASLN